MPDSTEEKLLLEIGAHPDDDGPRIVLADWYEEAGNPRGEFIRMQCEMETLDWDDPRYIELHDAVDKLTTKHRAKWVKLLPKLPGVAWVNYDSAMSNGMWDDGRMYFRRGMVEQLAIKDFKSFAKHLDAMKEYGVASYIDFVDGTGKSFELMSELDFVRGVTFYQQDSEKVLQVLGAMASREKLRSLSINECSIGGKELQRLTQLEMPSLKALDVHFNSLGDSLAALYQWPAASQLQWLNIDLNDLGGRVADPTTTHILEFAGQTSLADLFSLSIAANTLSPIHMQTFSENAVMTRLTQLDLSSNPVQDDGIAALVAGPFQSLNFLELSTTKITDEAVGSIAASSTMAKLRRLNIGHNSEIGDESLISIAASEHLGNLTHLNLARTGIGERGAKALVESETLNSIRHLNIGSVELTDATLKALQKRYPRAIVKDPYR